MLEGVWKKGNPSLLLVGIYIDGVTMESNMEGSLKNKSEATIWSTIPGLVIYLNKIIIPKDA